MMKGVIVLLLSLNFTSSKISCFFSVRVLSHFSRVSLFMTRWTVACQAPSVHGILQARILEWVAISSSRVSS